MKKIIITTFILCVFLASFASAEDRSKSRIEMDYGTSYHLALFGQTLNPDAFKNLEPVYGLDGKAAEVIVENYRKSFEPEKEEPTYILSVGTSKK